MSVGWRWLRAAVLALLPVLAAPAGEAAAPAPLALRYEVYARGFPILALDFRIDETASDYSVSSLIRTIGVVDWIVGFAMHSASWGTIAADRVRPSLHESSSHSPKGGERRTHLDYASDGTVAAAVIPPVEPGQPSPPTAQQTVDTLDPLSAILAIRRDVVRGGSCDIRVPVFDGRRRYDLVLADDGNGPLAAAFAAEEGWHCKVDMVKIAGFAAERSGAPHRNEGEVWMKSPAAGVPPVPLRIDFVTDWGPITVQMSPVDPSP